MSVFKARDWWSTTAGGNEEYDTGCMIVGNLCNNDQALEQLALGSFAGTLRVYNPENSGDGYRAEHLLLEQNLSAPIIQLACGKFCSALNCIALAVLHPRRLSVYTLTSVAGAVAHGTQFKLQPAYSHSLHRAAFNMCTGPFGQVQVAHKYRSDKDLICVQSMDGTLNVFEQESFSFTRFLPDSLLPGPLCYIPSTDSFVTVSSARQVESYKYQVLAVATETKTKEEAQNLKSGKRVAADWTLGIGEQAISAEVMCLSDATDVLILGERTVFCVSEFGKLKFTKRLDYSPRCMKLYGRVGESLQYMVATHSNTLMLYRDAVLKWAAQLQHTPVQLEVCHMGVVSGGIVILDEEGHLSIQYLGTDPAMMAMPSTQYRETKYDEFASEIRKYQQIIREKSSSAAVLPTKLPEDDLKLQISVPDSLDAPSRAGEVLFCNSAASWLELEELAKVGYGADWARNAVDVEYNDDDTVPSLTVKIELKVRMLTSNVRVNVFLDKPLASERTEFEFPTINTSSPSVIRLPIYMKYNYLPASLTVDVTATYLNSTGAPRVTQSHFTLPLQLVVKPAPPMKSAMFKVTIDTNKPPVNLNDIFSDLLGMNSGGQGNALGFQFYGGPVVTVLASKTSQRYRLQSDDFASMWLLTKELIDRLQSHFGRKSGLTVSHSGALPLQEYFESLDAHYEYRMHGLKYRALLEQRASQFRAIQRRLLTRFKDKTPSPLSYLDTLLEGTFRQLTAIAEHAEDNKKTLHRASTNLSSATRLLTYLVKLSCDLSDQDYNVLQSVLLPSVKDYGDQGWEEMVDTALTHELRTKLSKTAKDHNVNTDMIDLGGDTVKLKKHIALFIDKLSKGATLTKHGSGDGDFNDLEQPSQAASKVLDRRNLAEASAERSHLGAADTPIGTRMGEKTSPRAPAGKLRPLQGGSSLAPLNSGYPDGDTQLPPLQGPGRLKPLRSAKIDVPDLDELTNGEAV